MDKPPWELEAEYYIADKGTSLETARTFVMLRWMHFGDLRPLADAIRKGLEIDKTVLNLLAMMIVEDGILPASLKKIAPYRLEAKRRDGRQGRPREPKNFARDLIAWSVVDRRLKEHGPGTYEAAVKEVAKDMGLSEGAVRKAYDRFAKEPPRLFGVQLT
jgi:hypothetical protein